MELPSLGEFLALLQEDGLFCDYLNTFLNLPVFSKRFVYNRERRKFEIDPCINSGYHLVEDLKVVMWIHQHRLPLFWHSELFLEYCLSSSLLEANQDMVEVLSSVSAVHQFRRFLFGGKGESVCLFWLDVERLRHVEGACAQSRLVSKIHHQYLVESSPFSLSAELKELITYEHKLEEGGDCLPVFSRVKALFKAQGIVLEKLGVYWCKQYMLHMKGGAEQVNVLKPSSAKCRSGNTVTCARRVTHLPRITMDEGSANAGKVARKLPHVHFDSCKLPHVPSSSCSLTSTVCTGTGIGSLLEGRCARKSVHLALAPSTQKLFHRSIRLSTNSLLTSPHNSTQSSQPLVSSHPYLCASLRSDFLAGNPFLRHLLSDQHTNQTAINHLLFWQSTELLFTRDEMKRLQLPSSRRHAALFMNSEGYPTARNLKQLVHLFVKDKAPHRLDLPPSVRRELSIFLSKGLGQNLLISAQEYVTAHLLQPWMEFLAQDHQNFIGSCTTQRLLDRLTSQHRKEHSEKAAAELLPDNIMKLIFSSSQLQNMWDALRLAESVKYPGIEFLPSRSVVDVSLHKPVEDNDDEDRGSEANEESLGSSVDLSINPMLTTVYTITCTRRKLLSHHILSVTLPACSGDVRQKKPQPPKNFTEVLKDPEQLDFFRHFLQQQGGGAEVQLLFWIAVDDMKSSMGNERTCRSKTRTIQQRFFRSGTAERTLQCRDPAISELSSQGKPNPFQLLAAQAAVMDSMEKAWYQRYLTYLTKEEGKEEEEEDEPKKPACREHTKNLWKMFAVNVVSFRRGLMNPTTSDLFCGYLRDEVIKCRGASGNKKLIGTKVVNVTKLLNDLSFWVEVERYKNLADMVNAARDRGTHTPEDDIMIYKKAHAIVNCYIDSAVYPRVQVNIPNEIVQYILDNISQGLISRGLFHEAALNIFSVLIFYWKRFCMVRYAHVVPKDSTDSVARQAHIATPSGQHLYKHSRSHLYPTPSLFEGIDCGPILSFSLSHGLRWIKPTYGYLHGVDSQ